MPFSIFGQQGDPKVFYLDGEGILPEFQLIACRDSDEPTGKIMICAAHIPPLHYKPPHLVMI